MKNILVVYYTQTGQLKDILDNIVHDIKGEANIDFVKIEPEQDFPFPWTSERFFDAVPESVLQIPTSLKPMPELRNKDYDLIIFGYQPWFLSQSIPANSFLKSEWAKALSGKPVVTVLGCRNMWLHAQETVKKALIELGAHHKGHIVFQDNHSNLTSLRTTLRWFFKGQKDADDKLPEAGVAEQDMLRSRIYGPVILKHLENNTLNDLQQELVANKAVFINNGLILLEGRGISRFPVWAQRAVDAKTPEDRKKVLKKFSRLLIANIFVLSHIANVGAKVIAGIKKKAVEKQADYFRSVEYIEGKM